MAGKSTYTANKVLDHLLRGQASTAPSALYVSLFTVSPTAAGGGTEVSGGAYARKAVTFSGAGGGGAAANGQVTNVADVVFDTATADWGTVVAFAIHDALTSGNMLYFASLAASRLIQTNDAVKFPATTIVANES